MSTTPVVLSISNHAPDSWPEEQLADVRVLGGEPHHVPFPEVDPGWSDAQVAEAARSLLDTLEVPWPDVCAALVAGEYSMTLHLVRLLQQRDVGCFVATTARDIETTADGRQLRSFRFRRLRSYPPLGLRPRRGLDFQEWSDPARAERLRGLARDMGGWSEGETIVAVPSNAEIVAGAILAWRPRRVVLVLTRGIATQPLEDLERLIQRWPFDWVPPVLERLPDHFSEPEDGLPDEGLLGALDRHLGHGQLTQPPGFLINGGQSHHSALLTRQAEAVGGAVLDVQALYSDLERAGGPEVLRILEEPVSVFHRTALRDARRHLRGRQFRAAREALDRVDNRRVLDAGHLAACTRLWCGAVHARDGLDWAGARTEARLLLTALETQGPQVLKSSRPHRGLADAARQLRANLDAITGLQDVQGHPMRVGLVAELLVRARAATLADQRHMAALLYYRSIEACTSERLTQAWGIDPAERLADPAARWPGSRAPEPGGPATPAALLSAWELAIAAHDGRLPPLQVPLGLGAQLVLLDVLADPVVRAWTSELVREVGELTRLRNQSLFAHGLRPVSEDDLRRFARLAEGALSTDPEPPRDGAIDLVAPDGPSRGQLARLLRSLQGPVLADDGTLQRHH